MSGCRCAGGRRSATTPTRSWRRFFTPGVPRELRRMLEEQIVPRLLARSGAPTAIKLKRFHSYGLGESHVDALLDGIAALVPDGSAKLGFRAHYPQIETKVTVRGADPADIERKLGPVVAEVRKRLGNFIMAEDDDSLEGVILQALQQRDGSLTLVESFTSGQMAARIAPLPGAESVFRRGIVAREIAELWDTLRLTIPVEITREGEDTETRRSRILGGREWVRLGAVELGLDCLRRQLYGLPVTERIDFERT